MEKELTLDNIQIGMEITTYKLSGICNTYILLSQTRLNTDGSTSDIIEFIGDKQKPRDARHNKQV